MATEIELNYTLFDAFVILHGTDTMAYTSSALSFLLEDLGKTVVRVFILAVSPEPLNEARRLSRGRRYHSLSFEMTPWTTFWVLCQLLATTSFQVSIETDHSTETL